MSDLAVPLRDESDVHLLQKVASGHADALAALQQRHHVRIGGYIAGRIADRHLREEVEQDVWLTVWHHASRFRGESRVLTWLLAIAHNKAMGALRRRWPEPIGDLPEISEGAPGPEARLEALEQREAISSAIQTLSATHRATLDLILGQGLSLQEAADVMQCPVGTVKSRLSYARKYLARELERTEAIGGEPRVAR